MIKPHGSEQLTPKIVNTDEERVALLDSAKSMKKMKVNSAAAANLVMLGAGYFTPLEGFMGKNDVISVANNMRLESGLFWPTPVVNLTNQEVDFKEGDTIALIDPNVEGDQIIAIQNVDKIEELNSKEIDNIVTNTEEPTFENTVAALDFSGELLSRTSSIFFNLNSAETSDEIQSIAKQVSPLLSEFSNDIGLNEELFKKINLVISLVVNQKRKADFALWLAFNLV